jgi:septal ring factor EnvC (AmiA/AmiB activator)
VVGSEQVADRREDARGDCREIGAAGAAGAPQGTDAADTSADRNAHEYRDTVAGMGLGSTAKKLQTVADMAEKLYAKVNEIRQEVESVQDSVEETESRVEALERDIAQQRALVEALADAQGVDVDAVLDEVDAAADGGDDSDSDSATAADEKPANDGA